MTVPRLRRYAASGLLGVAAAALAACTAAAVPEGSAAPLEPTSAPTTPAAAISTEQAAAADGLLRAQVAALAARDRAAYAATLVDPRSSSGRAALAAYDVLTTLGVRDLRVDRAREAPEIDAAHLAPDGEAFVARETLHYRLVGVDPGPASADTTVVVVRTPQGWRINGSTPAVQPRSPWTLPGAQVRQEGSVVIIGNAPAPTMAQLAADAAAARDAVDRIWRRPWNRHLVVVAPATVAQWQALLGPSGADPTQVAAVTDGPLTAGLATADRIVVNPEAWAALTSVGRRVVLAHEATHVAVRTSVAGPVPLWLSEGMAEVVAYAATDLTPAQIAPTLRDQVRAGQVPTGLPQDAAFDPGRGQIERAYNASWLAVELVRDRAGAQGVTDFMTVAASDGLAAAYRQVLSTTEADFTRDWLTRVEALGGT